MKRPKDIQPKPVKSPEELEGVWDDEVAKAFKALNPKQQTFLIEYLKCGVSSEAYRRAYNPNAEDHLASVHGSRLVANTGIRAVLAKFEDRKVDALFTVTKTYFEMTAANRETEDGEKPDWRTRKEGADGLSKIFGLNAPEKVQDDRFTALLEHMSKKDAA